MQLLAKFKKNSVGRVQSPLKFSKIEPPALGNKITTATGKLVDSK